MIYDLYAADAARHNAEPAPCVRVLKKTFIWRIQGATMGAGAGSIPIILIGLLAVLAYRGGWDAGFPVALTLGHQL